MTDTRFIRLGERTVHVADHGGHGPTWVLVHGLGGSHLNWHSIAPGLTAHGRIVALDLPGFGYSPPARRMDLDTHAGAVIDLVERLGAPAMVMGNSMGGLVAELVASRRPELVAGLVLIAPATPLPERTFPADPRVFARLAIQSIPGVGLGTVRYLQSTIDPAEMVRLTLGVVTAAPGRVAPDVVHAGVEMAARRRAMPWAAAAFAQSAAGNRRLLIRRGPFLRVVRRITAPTLLLWGEADRVVSDASMRWLAGHLPDWETASIPGVGHVPMLEMPEATLSAIAASKTLARALGGRGYSKEPGLKDRSAASAIG
jgi:pimeloyl-ACP methyl ester carboxylesterase